MIYQKSIFKKLCFICCSVAFLLLSCACGQNPPRLHESGINRDFSFAEDISFADYIAKTREMITLARQDFDIHPKQTVVEANSPFQLAPDSLKFPKQQNGKYQKGILLIHGLSDSPYHLKSLAGHFRSKGFFVRGILLPGHGTVPADLLHVSYQDWIKATEYGMNRLRMQASEVYIGGFSTGGALGVHYALEHQDVKGLFLFAPALGIRSKFAKLAGIVNLFKSWLDIHADADYAKYESFATNAGVQINALIKDIDAKAEDREGLLRSMPVFMALSAEDFTIDPDKALGFIRKQAVNNRIVLFTAKDGTSPDLAENIHRLNSYLPQEKIIDFSHLAVIISPDDPHYGRNGDYKNCLHYKGDKEKQTTCQTGNDIWYGERSPENLDRYLLRRLTFNPLYSEMIKDLDRFIDSIE
ncbi:MAG: alpha/beta fold hydrolase [Proteobacteria bacterium]|nr:alpha/beta fold hydrolase [Pseudomonadota bacterium]MBU1709131.1 alpha/beta fold hydrolase [Pseudomonadota bacterium]